VLSGDPSQGEAYLHELVHVVLRGRLGGGAILGEGAGVWLGGSKGRSPWEMYRVLVRYQEEHPLVTLEALVRGEAGWDPADNDAHFASGALFIEDVYRRRGVAGLRTLAGMPNEPAPLLAAMRRHLGLPEDDRDALERWWRVAARRVANPTSP
jgi:hypothetical protein